MLDTANQSGGLAAVFRGGTELKFEKGERIIRPGDTPPGVFYIESGLVKAYDITKYGEENLLIIRKECEIFPLIWAVTGRERYVLVIYEAISPVVVRRISRRQFINRVWENPESMAGLLDLVIEMYRLYSERILSLEYRSVRERLVSFLLIMATRFGRKINGDLLIDAPLRQQDIASSISASREATSRTMSALERQSLISNKSRLITIHDEVALRAYLTVGGKRTALGRQSAANQSGPS
jgi:CRP/FNR family transcriptional regulator